MVVLAQLVEHRLVVPVVAGSSPVSHPIFGETQALDYIIPILVRFEPQQTSSGVAPALGFHHARSPTALV